MRLHRCLVSTVLLAAGMAAQAQGSGEKFQRECADWVAKKGYSVDYIEQRVGQRPVGRMAADWVSNLDPKDVRPNDVVFLAVETSSNAGQRAEVVDQVLRHPDGTIRALRTSSMNIGKLVVPQCHVTENFGVVTQRNVRFDRVVRAWRAESK